MEDNWRKYLSKTKGVHSRKVAASMGSHNGGDIGDEDKSNEEGTKHAIGLPDDDFDD